MLRPLRGRGLIQFASGEKVIFLPEFELDNTSLILRIMLSISI